MTIEQNNEPDNVTVENSAAFDEENSEGNAKATASDATVTDAKVTDVGVIASETSPKQAVSGTAEPDASNHLWYRSLNEDWLATGAGLLLVILIVIGWLHSIP